MGSHVAKVYWILLQSLHRALLGSLGTLVIQEKKSGYISAFFHCLLYLVFLVAILKEQLHRYLHSSLSSCWLNLIYYIFLVVLISCHFQKRNKLNWYFSLRLLKGKDYVDKITMALIIDTSYLFFFFFKKKLVCIIFFRFFSPFYHNKIHPATNYNAIKNKINKTR